MNARELQPYNHSQESSSESSYPADKGRDDELWLRVVSGDTESIGLLYNHYSSRLCKYGFQLTSEESIVYDALQDTFLYLIQKAEKLSSSVNVKAYLFASYRRKVFSLLKANRKEKVVHDKILTNETFFENGDSILMSVNEDYRPEIKKLISAASKKLSARQQEVIFLHFYEGMSYKDIAEAMGFQHIRSARNLLYKSVDILAYTLRKYKGDIWPLIIFSALLS
ncbi:RNA polymerase sigma factor [Algoriphagus resistens]|uniref:RNA polymerase sigma factor n=1 Tax=Algoriphagus resistens TaxID=1750590 RepID=UPI0007167C06|nr:sigma-70 family RNA polymerase sigma factor [Algoriphagus resistens]